MAELGSIGLLIGKRRASSGIFGDDGYRCRLRGLPLRGGVIRAWNLGGGVAFGMVETYRCGVTRDIAAGNPSPSLSIRDSSYPFRLAVKAGARTVSVDVRQPQASAARPRLRVRANPSIGLPSDLEAAAGAATDWQTLSVAFTATANGGVRVELANPGSSPCWFDNLRIV